MALLRSFFLLFILLFPAGCGQLPQPFAHGPEHLAYPLAELSIDVKVEAVSGLPEPAATSLARALAETLGGHGVTASHRPKIPSRFILRGVVEDTGSSPTDIADLTITWTLIDETGESTGLHIQELRAAWTDWQRPDPGFIRLAGGASAKAIADLVIVDAKLVASEHAGRAGLFLTGISGAPGDGDQSLAIAIRGVLASRGISLAASADEAAHLLSAKVEMAPPVDGQQKVSISWHVDRPNGESVGDAAQENDVPAGSLDGRWGMVAGYAASAAVDGIAQILEHDRSRHSAPGFLIPPDKALPCPAIRTTQPEAANSAS